MTLRRPMQEIIRESTIVTESSGQVLPKKRIITKGDQHVTVKNAQK